MSGFISYGGNVYITDGFTRRHIATPTMLDQLHAAAGKPPIVPVAKSTFNSLAEYVPPQTIRNDINTVSAQVENLRRIIVG